MRRSVWISGALVVLLIAALSTAYLLSNSEPSRPSNVAVDAVFLWAPYVGFPGPRRGWWVSCKEEKEQVMCEENEIDGSAKFGGEYELYKQKTASATVNFRIDPKKSRESGVFINHKYVHLIYLTNGPC